MNKIYKAGKINDKEFWSWALDQWKINLTVDEIINLLIAGYETDPKAVETVKQLRHNGYKTLICSNNFPARVNGLQKKFKFLDNFDTTVFSYKVGATKPSKKIFKKLVDEAGVRANEIVFTDDNNDNLEGAKEVGINAFFYEGFNQFVDKLKELGVKI